MVYDTHDHHGFAIDTIEYPVAPVDEAADVLAERGLFLPGARMADKQVEQIVKAQKISVCRLPAELIVAVYANGNQIGARRSTEPQFSHGGRDARS